jgi:hypothetical protein
MAAGVGHQQQLRKSFVCNGSVQQQQMLVAATAGKQRS